MTIPDYINDLHKEYKSGRATEHSYRGYLQTLIKSLVHDVMVTNEPQRVKCGAPDYIITRRDIPIGYIEAKDIGAKLDDKLYKEQFDRYRKSLNNLLITDYLDFWLYIDGELVKKVRIGEVAGNGIKALPENQSEFTNLIKNFCTHVGQTIKSPKKLAEMMAGKARMLSEVIEKALNSDEENQENSTLKDQMHAFKQILIHDITAKGFADVYAQTIAYGMFAARLHDPTLPTFSRQEAASLIPKSNPFLRKLFGYIAGIDVDDRIKWIVDSLAEVFLACNVEEILKNYGKSTKMEDPIIHFYETFLSEYDPALRKARGVWYTPQPVVDFIVRAVDDILKTEFNLSQGLADTSKTKIKRKVPKFDERSKGKAVQIGETVIEEDVHRVQILDPATGTGTFLAEVVKHIHKKFKGQQGIWSQYVEQHLLPRLNGFELLMASYAMAHLKLDLLLTETGFKPTKEQRFKVYLTNSLEESHPDTGTLFASWLSSEANEANQIKRDTPVMVILGNPPYSVSSTNKSEWIQELILDYKKGLNERKINLDDDYIKFIRFGQHFIDKNGNGILAYISNNSFIDGVTHRQMRKTLLDSFDSIYILDLHGNAKKKETGPEGKLDQNVFDIMQGVSINLFVKSGNKKKGQLANVRTFDLFGDRGYKYLSLIQNRINTISWNDIQLESPYYFFKNLNYGSLKNYEAGFKLDDLFRKYNSGIQTKNDGLTIKHSADEVKIVVQCFKTMDPAELSTTLKIKDSAGWKIKAAKDDIVNNQGKIIDIQYRLFDVRKTYFTGKSQGFIGRTRGEVMDSMVHENIALIFKRTGKIYGPSYDFIFVSKSVISEGLFVIDPLGREYLAPLYMYPEDLGEPNVFGPSNKMSNLNPLIVDRITARISSTGKITPINILDYVYGVLNSISYRDKYKDFLKIDFPRVPYPTDANKFWKLVKLGGELRQIHLLESDTVNRLITQYPVSGDNVVGKVKYADGKVWINEAQYFANVPQQAWGFYIGGYQPAQKWLKDRKYRQLTFDDILHYQKIIVALTETGRIMKEIDEVGVE